jgi:hypothetical protein
LAIQTATWLRTRGRPAKTQEWLRRLASWNVLLNDGMVVSFTARAAAKGMRNSSAGSQQRAA